ncbi:bifunctional (p)ppGpp synthetase/guanosine-3',5'-bis(diphosphate) 3'-pyrophosphohydrolase [Kosmotoga sp.]|uniref:RelA/SpoT family protein n=1 Tax=Kosmotoga sp. TaxID=1955248 RepID=UPI0024AA1424|nr:bifunctional (p)ppGpp synthetase/guanosine-3',5'-bis(diphosphate) 3'-pyrophosphohydrolase [Kosmotoga sp.]MDI3523234.1 diphosphokinase / guanosine-3,5-bis(diphosphate) 3-diphosphatase [Kosmotoga sp.]MDK2952837.1 diphosphokinase / guanosine-3,5-bis(diphosphate) 3-diphosphatase [Kosmotoga sp.]
MPLLYNGEGSKLVSEIEKILQKKLKRRERERIISAYELARENHEGQYRESGEPFISHPVAVTKILAELQADTDTLVSGLLHDVVEDCNVPLEDVENRFGPIVAKIVDGVTKINNLKLSETLDKAEIKSRIKIETIRKMLLALSSDPRIIIVKLADRLHNMRTLYFVKNDKKRKDKALETLNIYAPIAHRIGIHRIKWELEDLSFKYLYPNDYNELKLRVKKKLHERQATMDEYRNIVANELRKHRVNFLIEGRVKHLYSIWQKMIRKNKSFDEIYDLIALRIITEDEVSCYKILGIVHSLWPPVPGRFKDYIAAPKSNGYKSLHTTLITHKGEPLEIQIRSEKMHKEAEFGLAAHWIYKEGIDLKERSWFHQLSNWHKDFIESFKDIESVSKELETDEVFVFTPKGEVIHLPKGATPIDFAYAIHTEIGHHLAGAKVNGKMVPINYQLQLGDRVEIIVNKNSEGPSLDWLNYVRSNSTKAKIRRFFKTKYKNELVERGKETFRKISKKLAKPMEELLNSESVKELMKRSGVNTENEFFMKLGDGTITMAEILKCLEPQPIDIEIPEKLLKPVKPKQALGKEVLIAGQSGIDVHFAKCCNPLPGDKIVAVISSRGISIHVRNCKNLINIAADKLLEASWTFTLDGRYDAWIKAVFDTTEKNVVGRILEKIENKNAKVKKYYVSSGDWGQSILAANLLVKDIGHLTSVMESIRGIRGVQAVARTGGLP